MTPEVIAKLEVAFMNAFNDTEACIYAGISLATLQRYEEKHPKFSSKKESFKAHPNMLTKQELVKGIAGNLDQARWWAKNKMRDEFSEKTEIQHNVEGIELSPEVKAAMDRFHKDLYESLGKKS